MQLSLLGEFPLLSFASFGLLCLQVSSVSNFHPDMRRRKWPLIRAHLLSCALERERHLKKKKKYCWHVWGVLTVDRSHWVATAQGGMYFPGPSFSGSQVCHEDTVPDEPCVLCTSQIQASQAPGAPQGHSLRYAVCLVHLPSLSCSGSQLCCEHTVPGGPFISSGELVPRSNTPSQYKPSRIPGRCD